MKKYSVAILGATGAVGREMMKVLEERNFPINELRLLASERSVGKELEFCGKPIKVQLACHTAFEGLDIVLGAATNTIAKEFAPSIVKAGAVFVDNSSAFRMCDDVPLVVPEINPEDAKLNKGIISNPNCSTIITLTAINAINKISKIQTIVASTYQAVSGAGIGGPAELNGEVLALSKGEKYEPKVFSHQIAFNVIPKIGNESYEGYTSEEMKLQNESRKILHLPNLKATCTCVRVPVVRSHSISATIVTEEPVSVEDAKNAVANGNGTKLVDDISNNIFPMPLDTSDQDLVFVGRIRKDLTNEKGLSIWCCGDQVRKGAATNAVQIAQLLTEE